MAQTTAQSADDAQQGAAEVEEAPELTEGQAEHVERRKNARKAASARRKPTAQQDPEVDGIDADSDPVASVAERSSSNFGTTRASNAPAEAGELAGENGQALPSAQADATMAAVEGTVDGLGNRPDATIPSAAAAGSTPSSTQAAREASELSMAQSQPDSEQEPQPTPDPAGEAAPSSDAAPSPDPADTVPGEYDPAFDRGDDDLDDDLDEDIGEDSVPAKLVSAGDADAPSVPALGTTRTPNRAPVPSASDLAQHLSKHVCPFCGNRNENALRPCTRCGMSDNQDTRRATTNRVGPWFLLRQQNPSAPGMRFSVLRELVRGGSVAASSVVRGPTTQQLWTFAARVRGLAHLFGLCWNCNRRLPKPGPGEMADDFCIYCGALLDPPSNPDQQLEALETGEAFGVATPKKANQASPDTYVAPRRGKAQPHGKQRAHIAGSNEGPPPTKQISAKPDRPMRVVTTKAGPTRRSDDGSDALLSSRDLTTAFKLDEKTGFAAALGKLPLGRLLIILSVGLFLLAAIILAFIVLAEPLKDAF